MNYTRRKVMAGWIPPVAAAVINRCGANPEQCVRSATNAMDSAGKTAQVFIKFNQEMFESANRGDPVAHSYMYPECPYLPPHVSPQPLTPSGSHQLPPGYVAIPPRAAQDKYGNTHVIVAIQKSPY
jgi:hypothetical protein